MRIDAQNLYSDAQAITADAASTNSIDHGSDRNIGLGEPLSVVIIVDVAAAGGGTLAITIQTDDKFPGMVAGQSLSAGIDCRLGRYVRALESSDMEALTALLADEAA